MKRLFLFTAVMISIIMVSCKQKSESKETEVEVTPITEAEVVPIARISDHSEQLKLFYTQYIESCEKEDPETLNALLNDNVTQSLLNRIQAEREDEDFLEYDPITNAQDCFTEMLNGLEVIQDPENRNIYTIITDYEYNEDGKKRMVWELEEENGRYKINKILSDYHFR